MFSNKYKAVGYDRQINKKDLREITSAYIRVGRVRDY